MVLHHYMSDSSPCPDGSSSLHVIFFPLFFQRSMSLIFRVGVGFWREVPMVLHHYMSYSSPCSFKDPCDYHLGWGVGFWGEVPMVLHHYMSDSSPCPDGSSSLHVIFFPLFFQRSMSLIFRVWVGFWGEVPMVLHHYMSYSSPCSFKDPCDYHLGWGVGFWGEVPMVLHHYMSDSSPCPDGSSSLHVIFFPIFFQRSM